MNQSIKQALYTVYTVSALCRSAHDDDR